MKQLRIIFLIICLNFVSQATVFAQKTSISGRIVNRETKAPVPYANILFEHTTIGTISDIEGYYRIWTDQNPDKLIISAVGYEKQAIRLDSLKSRILNIELKKEVIPIDEIKVKPGGNPSHNPLRQVISHKEKNDSSSFHDRDSSLYNKLEIDLKNLKKPDENNKF